VLRVHLLLPRGNREGYGEERCSGKRKEGDIACSQEGSREILNKQRYGTVRRTSEAAQIGAQIGAR